MADPHLHPACDFGAASHQRPPRVMATRQLALVILITSLMMVAEIVGGLLVPSVALLADAGHMLTHLIALALAWFAIRLTVRPVNLVQTYGFYRVEILAALFNALTILLAVAYIVYDAVGKFIHPPSDLHTPEMIGIAVAGLGVNLAGAFLLNKVEGHDINIRGAMIHLISDTLSSVAVVAGGIVMHYTHWYRIDPTLAVVIAVVIVVWGWRLFRSAVRILLESAPEGMDVAEVCRAVEAVPGVEALHDAHVWEITSDMYVMTGHLLVRDRLLSEAKPVLDAVNRMLSERYRIGHTTFQMEVAARSGEGAAGLAGGAPGGATGAAPIARPDVTP